MSVTQRPLTPDELQARIGTEIGTSSWHLIDQAMVDRFAEVTSDRQFIHVDPARAAAETPFGGTIAHGFLTLSLLSAFLAEAMPHVEGATGINYGFDKIRFLTPVKTGARVRARFTLKDLQRRSDTELVWRHAVTVEIEGAEKPALVAEWLGMMILKLPAR